MFQLRGFWHKRKRLRGVSQATRLAYLLILTLSSLLCNLSETEPVRITDTPSPTITSSPHSSVTPSKIPKPTATKLTRPTSTEEVLPTRCMAEYYFQPSPPLCPAGEPLTTLAAEQPFEGGVMIWLESTDSIFVFYNDQRWKRFDDLWDEGQLASDPDIIPPSDRFQPIRGFGKIWRENETVRNKLGWALGPELGFSATTQESVETEGASVFFVGTYNGQVFALTTHDRNEGDWVIASA